MSSLGVFQISFLLHRDLSLLSFVFKIFKFPVLLRTIVDWNAEISSLSGEEVCYCKDSFLYDSVMPFMIYFKNYIYYCIAYVFVL